MACDEESRWDTYKQALDTAVSVLSAPLSIKQLLAEGRALAQATVARPRKRQKQIPKLKKLLKF